MTRALAFLNRLLTRDMTKLKAGRVAYCVWCDDAGHLIDDGTVFRLGAAEFRLCTGERQIDWLLDSRSASMAMLIEEVTEQIAALALQGPTSCAVLRLGGRCRRRAAETLRSRRVRSCRYAADHGIAHRVYRRPGL